MSQQVDEKSSMALASKLKSALNRMENAYRLDDDDVIATAEREAEAIAWNYFARLIQEGNISEVIRQQDEIDAILECRKNQDVVEDLIQQAIEKEIVVEALKENLQRHGPEKEAQKFEYTTHDGSTAWWRPSMVPQPGSIHGWKDGDPLPPPGMPPVPGPTWKQALTHAEQEFRQIEEELKEAQFVVASFILRVCL